MDQYGEVINMIETNVFYGDNEENVIQEFIEYIIKQTNVTLAGFNIQQFDIPMLKSRLIKYKMPPIPLFGSRWDYLDIRDYLDRLNSKGTLGDYLNYFGMEGKYGGYTGADVQSLYDKELWDEIRAYSEQDAYIEHKLLMNILDYHKPINNLGEIITIDIETVVDESKLDIIPKEIALDEYRKVLSKKYKKQETIDKYLETFDYHSIVKEEKNKATFNKFKNKIISISTAKTIYNDVF